MPRSPDDIRRQAGEGLAIALVAAMKECCKLASSQIESVGESIREGRPYSAIFKTLAILTGTGLAIWGALSVTPPMFSALEQKFDSNPDVNSRAAAGFITAVADTFIVIGGYNIGGWIGRGICDFFKNETQQRTLSKPAVDLDNIVVTRPGLSK